MSYALFLFVKRVDKTALIELPNEAHIDELLGFGGLRSGISLGNIIENGFESFETGILLLGVHGFRHHVLVAFLQCFPIETTAHVVAEGLNRSLFIGPHLVHRLHVGSNVAAYDVGIFLDVFPGCRCARMLKNETHLGYVRNNRQTLLFGNETGGWIDDRSADSTGQSRAQALRTAANLD